MSLRRLMHVSLRFCSLRFGRIDRLFASFIQVTFAWLTSVREDTGLAGRDATRQMLLPRSIFGRQRASAPIAVRQAILPPRRCAADRLAYHDFL